MRLIGCGGMGKVWAAASDDLPGQQLAVKAIAPEHAHHRRVVERFFGEARAASALDDPNVVKIVDIGRLDDGRPVLIMELVDGPSSCTTLIGRLPYQGDSELETPNLQVSGAPFRAPIELRPDTSPAWNALVLDCLQVDRASMVRGRVGLCPCCLFRDCVQRLRHDLEDVPRSSRPGSRSDTR